MPHTEFSGTDTNPAVNPILSLEAKPDRTTASAEKTPTPWILFLFGPQRRPRCHFLQVGRKPAHEGFLYVAVVSYRQKFTPALSVHLFVMGTDTCNIICPRQNSPIVRTACEEGQLMIFNRPTQLLKNMTTRLPCHCRWSLTTSLLFESIVNRVPINQQFIPVFDFGVFNRTLIYGSKMQYVPLSHIFNCHSLYF